MSTIQVDLVLLRGAVGDTALRPGTMLGAKVLERNGAHGLLLLQGAPLVAQLPEGVAAGQRLRLRVTEATAERIMLQVVPDAPEAQQAAASPTPNAAYALAMPGGSVAHVAVGEREAGGRAARGGGSAAISLRYDSPALGRMDVRLQDGACAVHVAAGGPSDVVRAGADELRDALSTALGRPVVVTVHPRRETFDARA